jgi:hypothetical protein
MGSGWREPVEDRPVVVELPAGALLVDNHLVKLQDALSHRVPPGRGLWCPARFTKPRRTSLVPLNGWTSQAPRFLTLMTRTGDSMVTATCRAEIPTLVHADIQN